MSIITCLPDNRLIEVKSSETVLEGLLNDGINHANVCGGQGNCSTCRVMILDGIGKCSSPTPAESELAQKLDFPFHIRLACQTKISGSVTIRRLVIDQDDIDFIDDQLTSGAINSERSVALLVASIQGANNFDEVNFHYDIIYIMSRYFHRMQKVIERYEGSIPNIMGVRLLAVFGIKGNSVNPVENAVWAGVEMLKAVDKLNIFLKQMSYRPINLTIGIHYGETVLVPMGSSQTNFLNPMGDATNIANRLELSNQKMGTQLLISESVYPFVMDKVIVGRKISFPSGNDSFEAYEVTGMQGNPPEINKPEAVNTQQRILSFIQKFAGSWGKSK
jgi:adenylate cyclase